MCECKKKHTQKQNFYGLQMKIKRKLQEFDCVFWWGRRNPACLLMPTIQQILSGFIHKKHINIALLTSQVNQS